MKKCRLCGREKPAEDFLAGKAKRKSSACSACRKARADQHRRNYYARLPADKRHTLTQRKRAETYGTRHAPYSRSAIFARWGNRCAYCNAPAEHLDHVMPLSRGGDDIESNMVPACADCNLSKGAKTLAEWSETFRP
ncbi:HNH endonuclease [Streptomyces sp. NPDC002644]